MASRKQWMKKVKYSKCDSNNERQCAMNHRLGWWELRGVLLVSLVKVPSAWQMASILFTAPTPGEFWCATEHDKDPCGFHCEEYEYSHLTLTFVTQWHLVCGREILVPVSQMCYLMGILVGGMICTLLLKTYSPKRIMISNMILQVAAGLGVAYAPEFELQCFLRFVTAASCAHMFTCGFILCTDITSGRIRTIVGCCYEHMWSVGVLSLAALGYLLEENWVQLQHAISLPTLLLLFAFSYIPDSPRWLMANGREEEAKAILEEAAAFNGTKFVMSELLIPAPADSEVPWYKTLMQPHILALHIAWSATVVTYYGALLNVKNLGPHIYFNTAVAGCAEILGVLLGLNLILYSKKKWPVLATILVVGGVACMLSTVLPEEDNDTREWQMLALAMFGRVAIAVSLTVLQVTSAQFLSRAGLFSSITLARIFLLGAPFIGYLAIYGDTVPLTTFGAITFVGGLATFFVRKPKPKEQQSTVWSTALKEGNYKQSSEFQTSDSINEKANQCV